MNTNNSIELVLRFWQQVWNPPYNIDVIDEMLTEDFIFVSAGTVALTSRAAFKEWAIRFQSIVEDGRLHILDTMANGDGTKVVGRWKTTGKNNGLFGLPPDGRPVELTGISIMEIREDRIAQHWSERSALECYQMLSGENRRY